MKNFEIERLLRAFGRKAHEHTLEAYMEFTRDYDSNQVKSAVDFAINRGEKLPPPAELRKFCTIGNNAEEDSKCELCEDKGFKLVGGKNGEFDNQGFRVLAHDFPQLCKCGAASTYKGNRRWVTTEEARIWNLARLLAKEVGKRAAGSELTPDLRSWRQFWWIDKEFHEWVARAKKLGGLVALVHLEEILRREDPMDCAEFPYRVCDRLIPLVNRASSKSMQPFRKWVG
tara:strand:- start:607 stop:1293 length:687 start_codon:yes stop_codon:yes gene_type:complete